MRAKTLVAALLALALPCAAAVPTAPQAVDVGYDMYREGLHIATMRETFESKDGEYRLISETHAVGLFALIARQPLRVTSNGRLSETGLQPLHFEGKRGDSDPRQVHSELDWQAGSLTISHDGRSDTLPLPQGTQDRLSVLYQFMFLAPEKPQRIEVVVTNGRKLDRYRYMVNPGVDIDTALGRLTTVHLVKEHRPDETTTELWLSPRHRYLPVRMLVIENGVRYEQFITRLDIREPQP